MSAPIEQKSEMTEEQALRLWATYIKRWGELVYKEVMADADRCEALPKLEQAYLHAFWRSLGQKLLRSETTPLNVPATNREQLDAMWRKICLEFDLPPKDASFVTDVEKRLAFFKRKVAHEFEASIFETVNQHEITSPIEQIFLIQWKYQRVEFQHGLQLQPQASVPTHKGTYTVDFIVSEDQDQIARVAIELDGHDFHERTKAQVASDKSRERAIVSAGLPVLRFTGSEVFNNPRHVIDEIILFFHQNRPDINSQVQQNE